MMRKSSSKRRPLNFWRRLEVMYLFWKLMKASKPGEHYTLQGSTDRAFLIEELYVNHDGTFNYEVLIRGRA
jgi:hypothetical protein